MESSNLPVQLENRLVDAVRREKKGWLKAAAGLCLFGAVFAPVVYFTATPPPGLSPLMAALATGGLFVVIGGLVSLGAIGDPRNTKGIACLRDRPSSSVVWLFVQYPTRGHGAASLTVGFDDGAMGSTRLPYQEAQELFESVCGHASDAAVGFTEERMARFHANPRSV